ncbi:MAG: hypothetical protein QXP32_09130 [Nitrososphaeria archaeon]
MMDLKKGTKIHAYVNENGKSLAIEIGGEVNENNSSAFKNFLIN